MKRVFNCHWLTIQRVKGYSVILLLFLVAMTGMVIAVQHGVFGPYGETVFTDFSSLYAAGSLAISSAPTHVYSWEAIQQTQLAIYHDPSVSYNIFFYPPPILLLLAPLAHLPYLVAFYFWIGIQLLAYIVVIQMLLRRILPLYPVGIIPFLAFPAVFYSEGIGQNALLTVVIMGSFFLFMDQGRKLLAGLILGCLFYKPHFGLAFPFIFLLSKEWRVFLGAMVSVLSIVALTSFFFTPEIWASYINYAMADMTHVYGGLKEAGKTVNTNIFISIYGTLSTLHLHKEVALTVHFLVAALATIMTTHFWMATTNKAIRNGSLIACMLLVPPVIVFYELLLMVLAFIYLVDDVRRHGWLAGEKLLFLLTVLLALFDRLIAEHWGVQCGPVVGIWLMVVMIKRFNYLKNKEAI